MGQILVRKIDDTALARLRRLASEQNLPIEALARSVLEEASKRPAMAERLEAIREMDNLRLSAAPIATDSTEILRSLRDGDDPDR